jgi:hypothetical protein
MIRGQLFAKQTQVFPKKADQMLRQPTGWNLRQIAEPHAA